MHAPEAQGEKEVRIALRRTPSVSGTENVYKQTNCAVRKGLCATISLLLITTLTLNISRLVKSPSVPFISYCLWYSPFMSQRVYTFECDDNCDIFAFEHMEKRLLHLL